MTLLSFRSIVVDNDHWTLILQGLWATVLITLFSLLIGTLLGGVVYLMTRSRQGWVRTVAKWHCFIVRGTPVMVLLLMMYYVVLQGAGGIVAAVIAFSLNFSNFACAMFRSSIDSVGMGQMDAGRALGFSKMQVLRYIVLPQALRNALPTYRYQAVTLLKGTSIVGYVAITDLTGAVNAVRGDTGESFLPLLLVTVIYFILAWLLNKTLDYLAKKTNRI